jgi:hypothetical protein
MVAQSKMADLKLFFLKILPNIKNKIDAIVALEINPKWRSKTKNMEEYESFPCKNSTQTPNAEWAFKNCC